MRALGICLIGFNVILNPIILCSYDGFRAPNYGVNKYWPNL